MALMKPTSTSGLPDTTVIASAAPLAALGFVNWVRSSPCNCCGLALLPLTLPELNVNTWLMVVGSNTGWETWTSTSWKCSFR